MAVYYNISPTNSDRHAKSLPLMNVVSTHCTLPATAERLCWPLRCDILVK